MPISAPGARATAAAGEFKETTASYRKTGPVEKYQPPPDQLKTLLLNGLAPIAPRVDELTSEGKKMTVQTIRAAEIAAKLQKGGVALSASEIAQAQISVMEALEAGLEDKDSPYYQADDALRIARAAELESLREELNAYLTGEARKPYDTTITVTRRRWGWARWTPPFGLPAQRLFPRREGYTVNENRTVTPEATAPLSPADITRANNQSRIYESYDNSRRRLAKDRFGKEWDNLTTTERRVVVYSASEQVSKQFRDEQARTLIAAAKAGEKDLIDDALEHGSPPEKALAKRMQKYNEDTESIMRRSKEFGKIKTVAQFKRFMGLDSLSLTDEEIRDAIIEHLGITDEKELKKLEDPNKAFKRLFETDGELGTALFTGKLYEWKLEKFAQDRKKPPEPEERKPEENPVGLSKETLIGMSPGGVGILLAEGKIRGIDDLKSLGISEDQARKIISDAEKTLIKEPTGSYKINPDTIAGLTNYDLAIIYNRGHVDWSDPAQVATVKTDLEKSFAKLGVKKADRAKAADDKIKEITELSEVTNGSLPDARQREIVDKWDKRSLALMALFLGLGFSKRVMGNMKDYQARGFQSMFA